MNGLTITGRIERRAPTRPRVVPAPANGQKCTKAKSQPYAGSSRTARLLALGHYVQQLIDAGILKDLSDAARRFNVSRARATQIANLTALSPRLQEAILTERVQIAERNLRTVVQASDWSEQEQHIDPLQPPSSPRSATSKSSM